MHRSPYHLVEPSPWPILSAMSALSITMWLTNWFHFQDPKLLLAGMMSMVITMMQWWRDIIREAMYMGKHTNNTQKGLRLGMLLFIISEICFFTAFFWAFFHSSLTPTPELGCIWPPMGIHTIDPLSIPLLNTAILLSSGISVTLAHHSLLSGKRKMAILSTMLTILLGMYFSMLQLMEYLESMFTIADSVYGSTFFVATGFHGAHVLMGTLFLFINLTRMMKSHFSKMHHFSFEAAAWYWHFVDVVWICLFMCIYWWGSL